LRKAADQAGLTAGLSAALQRAGKFAAVRSWDRAGVDGGRVVVSVLAATGHTNDAPDIAVADLATADLDSGTLHPDLALLPVTPMH